MKSAINIYGTLIIMNNKELAKELERRTRKFTVSIIRFSVTLR